jgi:flagella basal body P-ring formation protein FlgA
MTATLQPDDIVLDSAGEGIVAAIPIAEGVVIKRNWITQPPVVKSGDNVIVVVNGTNITIRDKGVAGQDGRIGDRVKVKLAGDSREVRGIVTGPGLVEIEISRRG